MELNQWLKSFQLKDNRLVGPFFYGIPLALRFEIGPADEAEELSRAIYLERAYARAIELLEQASSAYDYVVLSLLQEEDRDIDTYLWHFSSKFNFDKVPEPELIEVEDWTGEVLVFERYLFPIADQDLKDLLWEIIKADHGGFNYLPAPSSFCQARTRSFIIAMMIEEWILLWWMMTNDVSFLRTVMTFFLTMIWRRW